MHLTVYYSRRPIPGVRAHSEPAHVVIPANDFRFMVMWPGGENPRPELDPCEFTIGVRLHKRSEALPVVLDYRQRLLEHETRRLLGSRAPSTTRTSAFGARQYQPHMSILRPGSSVNRDLTRIGVPFRQTLGKLKFDLFVVDVVAKSQGAIEGADVI